MQRRDLGALLGATQHLLVDDRRADLEAAEVNDAMTNGVRGYEVVHRYGRLAVDQRELEARGAGVDDEDVQCGQSQSRIDGSSSPCSRV